MNTYIGIDLGTSAVKLLLADRDGNILSSVSREYPVFYPQNGWSEQNPEDWLEAVKSGLIELLSDIDRHSVRGISFGGQMHGLVVLDSDDNVIRPAILWNDGRTEEETKYLNEIIGKEKLSKYTANIAFAGFTAPKLLWLKNNEPENFKKIAKIMLPKDYIAYKMTGAHSTDYSDASGTLLLDVKNKCWSEEMLEICSVKREWLPKLYESFQVIGKPIDEFGLSNAIVTAGAGDNAAAAIGCGVTGDGDCNISLGTSGTVFISGDKFTQDKNNALHSFAHANGKYHLMGCILSAASCNRWWMEKILNSTDYDAEQIGLYELLGKNDVIFLPYLMGERSPHNDVNARGAFIGISPETSRQQMTLAVMEGVAFALKDCVEVANQGGISIKLSRICGGGARSKIWKKIIANVLGFPIETLKTEEGPAFGAAILAMVGAGEFPTVDDAVKTIVNTNEIILPDSVLTQKYDIRYSIFKRLYPSLKENFAIMNEEKT